MNKFPERNVSHIKCVLVYIACCTGAFTFCSMYFMVASAGMIVMACDTSRGCDALLTSHLFTCLIVGTSLYGITRIKFHIIFRIECYCFSGAPPYWSGNNVSSLAIAFTTIS